MKNKVGLWIDHKKAKIVWIAGSDEKITQIDSHIERNTHTSNGGRSKNPYGPQDVAAEDNSQRMISGHLGKFYDEVIASIFSADSILIMGPGKAKEEFKKRIKNKVMQQRVVGMETSDKLTDIQLSAKVRKFYHIKEKLFKSF